MHKCLACRDARRTLPRAKPNHLADMLLPRTPLVLASLSLLLATLPLPSPLRAQDHEQAMPNPKHPEHDALKAFVGHWNCEVAMHMPGMPEMKGTATETIELVCNGLWAKSIVNGTVAGQPMQGLSLVGYDPKEKRYTALWVDSGSQEAEESALTYDAKTKKWTSKRLSGPGMASRAELVFKDDNTIEQAAYMPDKDGKEVRVFHLIKRRGKPAEAAKATPASTEAVAVAVKAVAPAQSATAKTAAGALAGYCGKWSTIMSMGPTDGQDGDKGTEVTSAICDGRWLWSDFQATFMGSPFEGHCLTAFDNGKVTNYWIDNTTPFVSKLVGNHDAKSGNLELTGQVIDPLGNAMDTVEKCTWKGEHAREQTMEFKSPAGAMTLKIVYTRAHQEGQHAIKK